MSDLHRGLTDIVSPALLIAGLAVAGHIDGRGPQMHVVFGAGAGFGTIAADIPCQRVVLTDDGRLVENDCSSDFTGISFGGGLGLMWGRRHRLGMRFDGVIVNAPQGGRGAIADGLLVYRWHDQFILEGGLGVAYVVAQNLDGDQRGLSGAAHVLGGLPISDHVAGTLRLVGAVGGVSAFAATLGLEWSF